MQKITPTQVLGVLARWPALGVLAQGLEVFFPSSSFLCELCGIRGFLSSLYLKILRAPLALDASTRDQGSCLCGCSCHIRFRNEEPCTFSENTLHRLKNRLDPRKHALRPSNWAFRTTFLLLPHIRFDSFFFKERIASAKKPTLTPGRPSTFKGLPMGGLGGTISPEYKLTFARLEWTLYGIIYSITIFYSIKG
jgi:hypothetical protein